MGNQRTAVQLQLTNYVLNRYANIGQLKVADSTINTEDRGYAYDAAWNLSSRTNNGTTQPFSVDGLNQLVTDPNYYDENDLFAFGKFDVLIFWKICENRRSYPE